MRFLRWEIRICIFSHPITYVHVYIKRREAPSTIKYLELRLTIDTGSIVAMVLTLANHRPPLTAYSCEAQPGEFVSS